MVQQDHGDDGGPADRQRRPPTTNSTRPRAASSAARLAHAAILSRCRHPVAVKSVRHPHRKVHGRDRFQGLPVEQHQIAAVGGRRRRIPSPRRRPRRRPALDGTNTNSPGSRPGPNATDWVRRLARSCFRIASGAEIPGVPGRSRPRTRTGGAGRPAARRRAETPATCRPGALRWTLPAVRSTVQRSSDRVPGTRLVPVVKTDG